MSKATYDGGKRDLLWRQKRPTIAQKRPTRGKRPTIEVKETHYRGKRDLLEAKETYDRGKRDLL